MLPNDVLYVGVNDHDIDLFEGQYVVPNGVSYNAYMILDEKVAVMDTVDWHKADEYLSNVQRALNGRTPDYLVVSHMEPDHASSIQAFCAAYPSVTLVGNAKTWPLLANFGDVSNPRLTVKEGDTLPLGKHVLSFVMAPMVHWPEVMMTYDATDKLLFSADAFGKFGALDVDEEWDCEARRYYFNIVGKYGAQVLAVLKKAAALEIGTICPLHGPMLTGDAIVHALKLYTTWASYGVESEGVIIAYATLHGNTAKAANKLADMLREKGAAKVSVADLARDDMAEAIEDAFRYGKIVLAASTYDASVMPAMADFLHHLQGKNYQKRKVGLIENGSWAPMAAKNMRALLEGMKEITVLEPVVTLRGALKPADEDALAALADALLAE